jgi:hypothetical protein
MARSGRRTVTVGSAVIGVWLLIRGVVTLL